MILLETVLAFLVGAAALSLILLPILRPTPEAPAPAWDIPELEETRKGQALLALKEIDFDLATGKLSDADHIELKRRFTAEAVAAMREDQGGVAVAPAPARGPGGPACPTCGPRPEADAVFCSNCGRALAAHHCASCGAAMAPGQKFCESCGRAAAA
ncbi:MAG TPA: zinc ribbon domain-containing protein [Gemmatimonadales bacterium]|nr:zinc ribbon domain-containing protein [Gemmatimonadales bacterium]